MTEQIRVGTDTWKILNAMKDPGESFDDVIQRLIDENDVLKFQVGDFDDEEEDNV